MSLSGPALPILGYLLKDSLSSLPTVRLRLRLKPARRPAPIVPSIIDPTPESAAVPAPPEPPARELPRLAPESWLWQVQP
jgi:hypothetical protein